MIKFENSTNGRFYYIKVTNDLLNEIVLRIIYGGRNVSRIRTIACDDFEVLGKEISRLCSKRIKRGYKLIQ